MEDFAECRMGVDQFPGESYCTVESWRDWSVWWSNRSGQTINATSTGWMTLWRLWHFYWDLARQSPITLFTAFNLRVIFCFRGAATLAKQRHQSGGTGTQQRLRKIQADTVDALLPVSQLNNYLLALAKLSRPTVKSLPGASHTFED